MRWSFLLPTLAMMALAGCSDSSDALGPSTSTATPETPAQRSASNPAVTDSAPHRAAATTLQANPMLQLAGRTVARCESQLAPRIFVRDSAALAPPMSPAVTRVLAGRIQLRLPALLEFGARCPASK